jgi:hypothetical protein
MSIGSRAIAPNSDIPIVTATGLSQRSPATGGRPLQPGFGVGSPKVAASAAAAIPVATAVYGVGSAGSAYGARPEAWGYRRKVTDEERHRAKLFFGLGFLCPVFFIANMCLLAGAPALRKWLICK